MVYGSIFNGPGFYPPFYGGGFNGYFPNAAPNLYPSTFLPPGPALGGSMYPYRPFTGFFPPTYPQVHHHPAETTDWGKSANDYFGQLGDSFTKW